MRLKVCELCASNSKHCTICINHTYTHTHTCTRIHTHTVNEHIDMSTYIHALKFIQREAEGKCKVQLKKCEKRLAVSILLCTSCSFWLLTIQLQVSLLLLNRSHIRQAAGCHALRGWSTLATCPPLRRTLFCSSSELWSSLIGWGLTPSVV